MKTSDAIQAVIKAMCAAVEIPFVRAEQDGKRPKGVFLSYKIIQQQGEAAWRHSDEILPSPDSETQALVKTRKKSTVNVSCTVIGKGYGELWEAAITCLAWLDSEDAVPVFEDNGIMPKSIPVTVQDRTAYLETGFETRLGFDIQFGGLDVTETTVDAVDTSATIEQLVQQ